MDTADRNDLNIKIAVARLVLSAPAFTAFTYIADLRAHEG